MAVHQEVPGTLGPTIGEAVATDHGQVRHALREVQDVAYPHERRRMFQEIAEELARHEAAEEEIVYPALGRLGRRGKQIRQRRLTEERRAKWLVARLSRAASRNPDSREFTLGLHELATMVDSHALSEENEVLPLLESEGNEERLRAMAVLFRHAKQMAPTRPHPRAPDRLAGLLVGGPVLAVVDRLRDRVRATRNR
jgi:hemerythrin superfamily protein